MADQSGLGPAGLKPLLHPIEWTRLARDLDEELPPVPHPILINVRSRACENVEYGVSRHGGIWIIHGRVARAYLDFAERAPEYGGRLALGLALAVAVKANEGAAWRGRFRWAEPYPRPWTVRLLRWRFWPARLAGVLARQWRLRSRLGR
jgi:hypothetical protein